MWATASERDIGHVRLAALAYRRSAMRLSQRAPGEACSRASALCHTTIDPSLLND